MSNRLLQAEVGVSRRVAHESPLLAVDMFREVDIRRAGNLRAHARVDMILPQRDTRAAVEQGVLDSARVVSEAGDHAETGDDDPLCHHIDPVFWNRPTRRSEAV